MRSRILACVLVLCGCGEGVNPSQAAEERNGGAEDFEDERWEEEEPHVKELADQLSRFGLTWTFSEERPVGQFANGDWWVVGPVDIVGFDPPSQTVDGRVINGSMVNPSSAGFTSGYHGYDSELYGSYAADRYRPELNVSMGVGPSAPLTLAPDISLISTISWTDSEPPANGSFSQLRTAAVLTVLAEAPPADAFRPAYAGDDKTIRHRESDLDYAALGQLEGVGLVPDMAELVPRFERVWLDHVSRWGSRYMHPVENMPDYGRDLTSLYGDGALMLQLNVTDKVKRDLLVHMTQIGIDFFGNSQSGGIWPAEGGHGSGRKFPILFAGRVLHDSAMLAIGQTHPSEFFGSGDPRNIEHFSEDGQTFYVEETESGIYNWGFGGYGLEHLGMAEWGNRHVPSPEYDNVAWATDPYRRCCTANAWVGQTLASHVMNLNDFWNHPSYFDYMDRYMATELTGSWTRSWSGWQGEMWDDYRDAY